MVLVTLKAKKYSSINFRDLIKFNLVKNKKKSCADCFSPPTFLELFMKMNHTFGTLVGHLPLYLTFADRWSAVLADFSEPYEVSFSWYFKLFKNPHYSALFSGICIFLALGFFLYTLFSKWFCTIFHILFLANLWRQADLQW